MRELAYLKKNKLKVPENGLPKNIRTLLTGETRFGKKFPLVNFSFRGKSIFIEENSWKRAGEKRRKEIQEQAVREEYTIYLT